MTPTTRFFVVAKTGLAPGSTIAPRHAYADRLQPAYGVDWDDTSKRRADCVYCTTSSDTAAALLRKAGVGYAVYWVKANEAPVQRDRGEDAPGATYVLTMPPSIVQVVR